MYIYLTFVPVLCQSSICNALIYLSFNSELYWFDTFGSQHITCLILRRCEFKAYLLNFMAKASSLSSKSTQLKSLVNCYLCYKWPCVCSSCRNQLNSVLCHTIVIPPNETHHITCTIHEHDTACYLKTTADIGPALSS